MTYEDIKKINALLTPMDIKGKKYIPVNERVKAFRMLVPEGTIETDLLRSDDYIIVKAKVFVNGDLKATGYAEEKRGSSNINTTSPVENCESSAVGRALGFLGLGIDTSIATYEEVTNAKIRQEGMKFASKSEREGLFETCKARDIDIDMLMSYVGFDKSRQPVLTVEQYGKAMEYLNKEVK